MFVPVSATHDCEKPRKQIRTDHEKHTSFACVRHAFISREIFTNNIIDYLILHALLCSELT